VALQPQRVHRRAACLEVPQQLQHARAVLGAARIPSHVVVVDELGVRRVLLREAEHEVDLLDLAEALVQHVVSQLAGLRIDRLVHHVPAVDVAAEVLEDTGDVDRDQALGFLPRIGAEVMLVHPPGQPLGRLPDERVAADAHALLLRPGEHLVRRPEPELARARLDGLPLGLVLGDDQAAFARHQGAVRRVLEAHVRPRSAGAAAHRVADAHPLAPRDCVQRLRIGSPGGERAGERRAPERLQRTASSVVHVKRSPG
jgi:hypothetical protein